MTPAPARATGGARGIAFFGVAQGLLVALLAVLLVRTVWDDAEGARAVTASAWLAVGVQLVTFAIIRLAGRDQLLAGWGLGVLLRFATVAAWAFLAVPALGLAASPALLSLCVFYFASTLVEPLFLNA
jgi:hypothetical protein